MQEISSVTISDDDGAGTRELCDGTKERQVTAARSIKEDSSDLEPCLLPSCQIMLSKQHFKESAWTNQNSG